ncbi:MAG TPA: peroxidase family protein [Solirubrobacteraceae bacterium]|nr:peroxidase family protein [Solirubrobacteraceae bacterium]
MGAAVGAALCVAAMGVGADPARAVEPNGGDLAFILEQIKRAEAHAAGGQLLGTGPNQISSPVLPYGLRTVNGELNNLIPEQEKFGAADQLFPRLLPPVFREGETGDIDGPGGAPPSSQGYSATSGFVFDSRPRTISNLIVDQSENNPAAKTAADALAPEGQPTPKDGDSLVIPNVAPDTGLSAPYNSWFTLFGQFFDHGLDLLTKGGNGTVIVPLKDDDPLVLGPDGTAGTADDLPVQRRFMALTRARNAPGGREHTNTTTAFVDQNQTYTSHPSHQVFLREYELNADGRPIATGKLLEGAAPDGQQGREGLSNWDEVKTQAREILGIQLDDYDALDVPLVKTDPYGRFIPDPATGFPQIVTSSGVDPETKSGTPTAPVTTEGALRTGHAFLDDIAHSANPVSAETGQRLPADGNTVIGGDRPRGTFDNELLDKHFITGDGRGNENIGLTAVHHVFHAEHNLRVDEIRELLLDQPETVQNEWKLPNGEFSGERLFQAARFVTEMEYQHLVFEEFARKVQPQVNVFAGYHTEIDPAIVAEFAHTVYRFGHSMLRENVDRTTATGASRNIGLIQAFLNPQEYDSNNALTSSEAAGQIVRGMTKQRGSEIDEFVTGALRSNLLGLPLDLATINMARGRDTGVPGLNAARKEFFRITGHSALRPYSSWHDFGRGIRHPESLVNFVAAYGRHDNIVNAATFAAKRDEAAKIVDPNATGRPADAAAFLNGTGDWAGRETGLNDVDFWVGGLAEKQMPFGGLLGSTFNFVFETQMEKLQDGDRMYYLTRTAGLNFLTQLEENSFAELVMRTTDTNHLPHDIFSLPDFTFELGGLGSGVGIEDDAETDGVDESTLLERDPDGTVRFNGPEHVVFGGTPGDDKVHSSEGDDTLWGDAGNDALEGGAGNDAINGGDDNDILTDLFGDDNIKGGKGNDAINAGGGFDLILAGAGKDFVVAGADPKETFGGQGDDFLIAGDSADTLFANEGNDWIEGGAQADLLQGENGDPFQEGRLGDDVLIGDGGDDDLDSEGGDDIMVSGPGIERSEGMIGFDWVTHRGDPQAANDDMRFTGLLPPDLDNIRERFDNVEGLSGWDKSDVLRGDDTNAAALGADHALTRPDLIEGLREVIGAPATGPARFDAGNILLGGGSSDILEGRGGDDIIDGDKWLNVRIAVHATTDPASDVVETVDSMRDVQARVMSGEIDAGRLQIVRRIESTEPGNHLDTAVFSDVFDNYTFTPTTPSREEMTVTHSGGTQADGTDTLRNIERLQFADQTISITELGNSLPEGAVSITGTLPPVEGQQLTATENITDANGIRRSSLTFAWQSDGGEGAWTTVALGQTFAPTDEEVGSALRVVATYEDGNGVLEQVISAPTDPVGNVNDPATGAPTLNDLTPQAGLALRASSNGIVDPDGLDTAVFSFQWEQETGDDVWTEIDGATQSTFTPGDDQVGDRLRVVVRFTDDDGNAEVRTSAATAAVAAAGPPAPGGGAGQGVGPGQGGGLGQNASPLAVPGLGSLAAPAAPAAQGAPGTTAGPGRAAGPAAAVARLSRVTVSATAGSPITVSANVPRGARVVRIRVFRLGGGARAAKAASRGKLVATAYRRTPQAKRYRFRLTERKLRNLRPGRYRIEVRAGRDRSKLGPVAMRSVTVKAAGTGARRR